MITDVYTIRISSDFAYYPMIKKTQTTAMLFGFVCSLVCFTAFSASAQETSDEDTETVAAQIMDSATGDPVELEALIEQLIPFEVIFLGEQHDNDSGHVFQFDVIKGLVDQDVDVVISMEQFERDVQGVLDDYLADRISEDEFLANSRPWKNYPEHYRPMIEFAKANGIPVLAGNVPRRLASDIAMSRTVKLADQVFLPRTTTTPENAYWQNFQETMKGHGGAGGGKMLKNFYASQCVKDDAMAEAITDYLATNTHRQKTVVHLCGHFHSDYGLGTAARVVQRLPLVRIAVVTMESIPENNKLEAKGVRSRGHYIFWTEANAEDQEEEDIEDDDDDADEDEDDE